MGLPQNLGIQQGACGQCAAVKMRLMEVCHFLAVPTTAQVRLFGLSGAWSHFCPRYHEEHQGLCDLFFFSMYIYLTGLFVTRSD